MELEVHKIANCCSRSFLALLLGAGVAGGFSVSAPAGDKIEFSSLDSEDLARPDVERAESEPADVRSIFSLDGVLPQEVNRYPLVPIAGDPPARRNDESALNRRSGADALSLSLDLAGFGQDSRDRFGLNGSLENSTWQMSDTNYSSKPASNYLDTMEAWGNSENLNSLASGMDKLDPRSAQLGARLESAASLERRALQNGLAVGDAAKTWASRKNDASGSGDRTSATDVLKSQNKSLSGVNYGLFRSLPPFDDARAYRAWGSGSLLSSDTSLKSPLDSSETGNGVNKSSAVRTPPFSSGKNSGNLDQGNWGGVPTIGGLGDDLGAGYQYGGSSAARKPAAPPLQPWAQRQQGGATLAWPKMPGAN